MTRRRRGLKRPRYIVPGDTRSPMLRLLADCQVLVDPVTGRPNIEVSYERQFQTLWKAERLGYVEQGGSGYVLTEAGVEFIKKERLT